MDKKESKAVALKYNQEQDTAPRITAKGERLVAEKIIKTAAKAGVPVNENPDLVNVLFKLDLNDEIPDFLYSAVAEVLAFVYYVKKRWESKKSYESK